MRHIVGSIWIDNKHLCMRIRFCFFPPKSGRSHRAISQYFEWGAQFMSNSLVGFCWAVPTVTFALVFFSVKPDVFSAKKPLFSGSADFWAQLLHHWLLLILLCQAMALPFFFATNKNSFEIITINNVNQNRGGPRVWWGASIVSTVRPAIRSKVLGFETIPILDRNPRTSWHFRLTA